MIDLVKKFFSAGGGADSPSPGTQQRDIRVATCALLLEMAEIDDEFTDSERAAVVDLMKQQFGLSDEHVAQIAESAQREREGSIDLWHFTNLINDNYTQPEKLAVVEMTWRLVYADGRLSDHEQYLMTKLRKMLRVTHRELIDIKLQVLEDIKAQSDEQGKKQE